MSCPADFITVSPEAGADDTYNALTLAIDHARSTTQLVEIALCGANAEGRIPIAPAILATALHGVATHLAAAEALATRLLDSKGGAR